MGAFLLYLSWFIAAASCAQATQFGSVSFVEGTPGSYLRTTASSNNAQSCKFSYDDVAATMAVLLGLAPPATTSDEVASKLDELLVPNPFHRPHAVLLLTLEHIEAGVLESLSAQQRVLEPDSLRASLVLPEDKTLVQMNTTLREDLQSNTDDKLHKLALFLGGSYGAGKEPSKGTLSLDLPDGERLSFDLEKDVDRGLVFELLLINQAIEAAAVTLQNGYGGLVSAALKITKELYAEAEGSLTPQKALDLLHLVATKTFTYLDAMLNGGLVGVIVHAREQMIDVKVGWESSRLQLLQTSSDTATAVAAEILTETIIAYITGIMFVVALIIGTCFLLKMPLTRDTLLYSGAKLD